MNSFIKKIFFIVGCTLLGTVYCSAGRIILESPPRAASNRQPLVVRVFLDNERDVVSGMAGVLSFPSEMFDIDSITTEDSIISLWVKQPSVSEEKYLDSKTHVTFEGIFPGGFDGVKSPYYEGVKPGLIFSITLIPKHEGIGSFVVDGLELNAYSRDAEPLPVASVMNSIVVPHLVGEYYPSLKSEKFVTRPTLTATVTRSELINNNAWYLVVNEREQKSAIAKIYVAETDDYSALSVDESKWRVAINPYTLLFQGRTKYVHTKVVYSDGTYTTVTVKPVENFAKISRESRILISVVVLLLLIYFYGKDHYILFRKKHS